MNDAVYYLDEQSRIEDFINRFARVVDLDDFATVYADYLNVPEGSFSPSVHKMLNNEHIEPVFERLANIT